MKPLQDAGTADISSAGWVGFALPRALYSVKETQHILSVSHAQIYRLIASGKLDARKMGSKTLITWESILELITSLPKLASKAAQEAEVLSQAQGGLA